MKKRPVGRPSKYQPQFCEMLIQHMSEGLSFETFASVIKVDRDTIYEWCNKHPDFSDAKKTASLACQLFWEKLGRNGAAGKIKNFNSTAYIYNCKNRFRKSETFGNDPDKIDLNTFRISYDPSNLRAEDE